MPSLSSTRPAPARLSVFLLVFTLLALLTPLTAQTVQFTQNTVDQSLRGSLQVDPSTMGMSFSLGLGGYGGRGVSLPLTLNYGSKLWQIQYTQTYQGQNQTYTHSSPMYGQYSASGWTASTDIPFIESPNQRFDGSGNPAGTDYPDTPAFIERILAHLPDGSTHELRKSDAVIYASNPPALSGAYYAVDGSRLRYNADTATLTLPDGSRYLLNAPGGVQYIDRNGNTLTYNSTSKQWTDTLGRIFSLPPLNNTAVGDPTYSLPGIGASNVTYTFRWRYLRDNSTGQTMLTNPNNPADPNPWNPGTGVNPLKYKGDRTCAPNNQAVSPSLFQSSDPDRICGSSLFNPIVLYQIVLPNNKAYTFTYNVHGEMDKVQLPTGGYERYEYALISGIDPDFSGSYAQSNRGVIKQWVSAKGDGTDEYLRQFSASQTGTYMTSATAPDNTRAERRVYYGGNYGFGFDDPRNARAYDERVYDANNVMLRRTLTEWEYSGPLSGGWSGAKRNARPKRQVEILLDTSGNALAKATEMDYDVDLNVITTREYDYVSISQSTGQTGAISSIADGSLLRTSEATYLVNDSNISSTIRSEYWNRNIVGLPSSSRVKNSSGTIVAQSEIKYDEGGTYQFLTYPYTIPGWTNPNTNYRGNATTTRSWLNTNGSWIETHAQYDQCGNLRNSWDGNGNQAQVLYADNFSNSTNYDSYAYPTQAIAPLTTIVTSTKYDYQTGKPVEVTDPNNIKMQMEYADPLLRPTRTIKGIVSGTGTAQTVVSYDDTNRTITTIADQTTYQESNSGTGIKSLLRFDGLGRGVRSAVSEGSTWAITDAEFDNLGRVKRTTNPFRDTNVLVATPTNAEWTTSDYDALSRSTKATTPDTAQVNTSYSGNTVTVTDQAGKNRKSETDALGRLTNVWENPTGLNYQTSYSYDTLDNLTTVTQGAQTRSFVYDSLKRLTSATNPESGTTTYNYDNNGNLISKVDALNRVTWYGYDALNRAQGYYTNDANTPQVVHVFDTATNGKGRLGYSFTSSYWVGCASWKYLTYNPITSYDALGRPTGQSQYYRDAADTTWGTAYTTARTYDLASNVKSQTYPSGHVVNYDYNTAGQMTTFKGNLGDGTNRVYASEMAYNAAGQMTKEAWGKPAGGYAGMTTTLYQNKHYNNRLQMYDIRLGTSSTDEWTWNRGALRMFYDSNFAFGNGGTNNNGNVYRMDHFVPTNESATTYAMSLDYYQYDALNRITGIWENKQSDAQGETSTGLTQQYVYDRFGNRTVNNGVSNFGVFNLPFTIDQTNNRLLAPNGTISYNAVGNQTNDGYSGAGNRTYDANNKLVSAAATGGTASYAYNANGSRIIKTAGGVTTWMIYGLGGELVAEYVANGAVGSPQKEYGYRGGQMLVVWDSTETGNKQMQWLVQDHLGSTRMVADLSGSLTGVKRHDYLPFGEELGAGVGIRAVAQGYPPPDDKIRQKFTGHERDSETGLDYYDL